MLLTLLTASAANAACGLVRRRLNRPDRTPRSYVGGRVKLTALWNHGAAFALPIPRPALLTCTAGALLSALRLRKRSPIGAGLILGGGLSNLAERLAQGKVYDYVQFPKLPGKGKSYVYNLADSFVFLGILTLLLPKRRKKT